MSGKLLADIPVFDVAEPYIKARGVESVRSKIRNVNVGNDEFGDAVVHEFRNMYGDFDVETEVGDAALDDPLVMRGYTELKVCARALFTIG